MTGKILQNARQSPLGLAGGARASNLVTETSRIAGIGDRRPVAETVAVRLQRDVGLVAGDPRIEAVEAIGVGVAELSAWTVLLTNRT